jgi:hypothetical protein
MKRIIVLLSIFLLINLGQSCRTEHYIISDIRFSLAEVKEDNYNDKTQIVYICTSTVKDNLVFIISYFTEFVAQNSFDFGNACYALTLDKEIDNPLLEQTFSINFNKPFAYNGVEIAELTNVFEIEEIRDEIDIYENYMTFCGMSADKVIDFSQEFFAKATFEKAEYEVTFSCQTSDGIAFLKTITIVFE